MISKIMCCIFGIPLLCFADVETKDPPLAQDASSFFGYSQNMMILPNFSLKNHKIPLSATNRLFKISTIELSKYGLKIGSSLQAFDLETGELVNDFKLKDYVYGILRPGGMADNENELNKLRVILSYDEEVLAELKKREAFESNVSGFAYVGLGRKLRPGKDKLIAAQTIQHVSFKLENWNPKKRNAEIKVIKIFDNPLYIYFGQEEYSAYIPILELKGKFYGLTINGSIYSVDRKFVHVSDYGEDTKILLLADAFTKDACSDLYFITKENLSYVPLPCNDKNR